MKRVLTFLILLGTTISAIAQEPVPNQTFRGRYYKFSKYIGADSGLVLSPTGFNAEPFAPTLRTISGAPHSLWFHNGTNWEKISGLSLQSVMSGGNNTSRSLAITNNGGNYSGDGLFLGHFPSTSYSSIYSVIDGSSVGSIRIAKDYIGIASGIGTSTELYVYPDSVRFGTPTHPVRVSGTAGIYPNDFVTLRQIRDSLGASSTTWSNVTSKPQIIQDITSGDAGLVSRLSISRPVQQHFVGDLNTVLTTGIGHVFASGSSNLPVEHNGTLYTGYHAGPANGGSTQIFVSTQSSGNMYFRRRHPNGTWYDWQRVLTEPNAASIYLPFTGGNLTGNLSGTTAEFTGTVSGANATESDNYVPLGQLVDSLASASVLEALDEGNGIGYRIRGRNPGDYGNIGLEAVDFSSPDFLFPLSGALGNYSFATGQGTQAEDYSFATGYGARALGDYSFASGQYPIASGVFSVALGSSTANGMGAVSMGFGLANGDFSVAIGDNSEANAYASLALGRYSDAIVSTPETAWVNGSPIITVGDGTAPAARSNSYVLYNDGRSEQKKDIEITEIGQGVVIKSPDGTRWRITVDNSGNLTTTSIP